MFSFISTSLLALQAVSSKGLEVMTVGGKAYTVQELFVMGGVMMWPILILSIVGVFVFILCLFITRSGNVMSRKFMEAAEALIFRRDMVGLEYLCEKDDSCIARIILRTVKYMAVAQSPSPEEINETAAAEGSRQAGMFTRKISWLSDIGAVAPMFGLLGTVTGMIRTFFEISNGNFEGVKQMQMAGGVAEALITTAAGLIIGIPALLAYSYFRGVVQKNLSNLESATTHIVTMLISQKRREAAGEPVVDHARSAPITMPPLEEEFVSERRSSPRL